MPNKNPLDSLVEALFRDRADSIVIESDRPVKISMGSVERTLIAQDIRTEQIDGLENFGGFTDGDRAVCLALALGVNLQDITLVGFSTTKVGKWSGQTNPERKLEKLDWMLKVLEIIGLSNQVITHASGER